MNEYAYIFDIGNVLINFDFSKLLKNISDVTEYNIVEVEKKLLSPLFFKSETGHITSEEYYKDFSKNLDLKWSYEDFIIKWEEIYSINEVGNNLLEELIKDNQNVYMLSNLAELNKIAIENKFENFLNKTKRNFYSYETGFRKPEIEIYQYIISELGFAPDKCIFFDDLLANIDASKRVKMNGIVFNNDIKNIKNQIKEIVK